MKKYLLPLSVMVMLLSACQKDKQLPLTQDKQDVALLGKLKELGFGDDKIMDYRDCYLVDGDILIRKFETDLNVVENFFKGSLAGKGTQTMGPSLISSENVERIRLLPQLSGTSVSGWEPVVRDAMAQWAGISNCKINYDYNGTIANTQYTQVPVVADVLPPNTMAAAYLPSGGSPGFKIMINTQFAYSSNYSQQLYAMVHEMGHCLGFQHTNEEGAANTVHIPGTPTADGSSIMNGGTALTPWSGFSANDAAAARILYPLGTYDRWITSPEGKYPGTPSYYLADNEDPILVNWNKNLIALATPVKLELYQYGVFKRVLIASTSNVGFWSGKIAYDPAFPSNQQLLGQHVFGGVQVKITSTANASINDMSAPFYITTD